MFKSFILFGLLSLSTVHGSDIQNIVDYIGLPGGKTTSAPVPGIACYNCTWDPYAADKYQGDEDCLSDKMKDSFKLESKKGTTGLYTYCLTILGYENGVLVSAKRNLTNTEVVDFPGVDDGSIFPPSIGRKKRDAGAFQYVVRTCDFDYCNGSSGLKAAATLPSAILLCILFLKNGLGY